MQTLRVMSDIPAPANPDLHAVPILNDIANDIATINADADPVDIALGDAMDTADKEKPSASVRKVDPMQGMKLETILQELVAYFGWEEMGYRINIRCFNEDPSIGSSLKFLRKTPWARKKVDTLFLTMRAEQFGQSEQSEQSE
jgi:DNA-binding protein VF530